MAPKTSKSFLATVDVQPSRMQVYLPRVRTNKITSLLVCQATKRTPSLNREVDAPTRASAVLTPRNENVQVVISNAHQQQHTSKSSTGIMKYKAVEPFRSCKHQPRSRGVVQAHKRKRDKTTAAPLRKEASPAWTGQISLANQSGVAARPTLNPFSPRFVPQAGKKLHQLSEDGRPQTKGFSLNVHAPRFHPSTATPLEEAPATEGIRRSEPLGQEEHVRVFEQDDLSVGQVLAHDQVFANQNVPLPLVDLTSSDKQMAPLPGSCACPIQIMKRPARHLAPAVEVLETLAADENDEEPLSCQDDFVAMLLGTSEIVKMVYCSGQEFQRSVTAVGDKFSENTAMDRNFSEIVKAAYCLQQCFSRISEAKRQAEEVERQAEELKRQAEELNRQAEVIRQHANEHDPEMVHELLAEQATVSFMKWLANDNSFVSLTESEVNLQDTQRLSQEQREIHIEATENIRMLSKHSKLCAGVLNCSIDRYFWTTQMAQNSRTMGELQRAVTVTSPLSNMANGRDTASPLLTRRVIFLDVDGVLHPCDAKHSDELFQTQCVLRLKQIVFATGSEIVLSSAWRLKSANYSKVEQVLKEHAFGSFAGQTPVVDDPYDRHQEIELWLEQNPCEHWIAIDDLPMPQLGDHYIQTDPSTGLVDVDVLRAVLALKHFEVYQTMSKNDEFKRNMFNHCDQLIHNASAPVESWTQYLLQ